MNGNIFAILWATFLVLGFITTVLLNNKGYFDSSHWDYDRYAEEYFCGCLILSAIPMFNVVVFVINLFRLYKSYMGDNSMDNILSNLFKFCKSDKVLGGNNIDNALVKRKEVSVIEERLAKEKKAMKELKGKAKDDIEWILKEGE